MKTDFGTPLSRNEMKNVKGGKVPPDGCTVICIPGQTFGTDNCNAAEYICSHYVGLRSCNC